MSESPSEHQQGNVTTSALLGSVAPPAPSEALRSPQSECRCGTCMCTSDDECPHFCQCGAEE